MKRSERLDRINIINQNAENMAGTQLATVYAEYSVQVKQLEQLHIYKDDYAEQLKIKLNGSIKPEVLRDYKYFFSSIDSAIQQQEGLVKRLHTKLENSQADWLDKHSEVQKINVAGDNMRKLERNIEAKKEQNSSDELSMRMLSRMQFSTNH
ncbi:MAG: flagellar export protein FliJ [Pseudomonadota bacterium]